MGTPAPAPLEGGSSGGVGSRFHEQRPGDVIGEREVKYQVAMTAAERLWGKFTIERTFL